MAKIDSVQEVAVEKLIPYENNARIHSEQQISKIMRSIKEFGFISPILIDEKYGIVAGHGRLEAAKRLGLKTVNCVMIQDLTEEEKKAYILIDNKLAEGATWDIDLLNQELENLSIDMQDFGFIMETLDEISIEDDYVKPYEEKGYSIVYELSFDTEEQQEEWYNFINELRRKLPDKETIAERVLQVAREWLYEH